MLRSSLLLSLSSFFLIQRETDRDLLAGRCRTAVFPVTSVLSLYLPSFLPFLHHHLVSKVSRVTSTHFHSSYLPFNHLHQQARMCPNSPSPAVIVPGNYSGAFRASPIGMPIPSRIAMGFGAGPISATGPSRLWRGQPGGPTTHGLKC